jgi:hypothetical protein
VLGYLCTRTDYDALYQIYKPRADITLFRPGFLKLAHPVKECCVVTGDYISLSSAV